MWSVLCTHSVLKLEDQDQTQDEVGVDVDRLGEEMEAKGETPPVECPPIECGQSDGAIGALYRKDRVSQSGSDTGHVVTERWVPASGQ